MCNTNANKALEINDDDITGCGCGSHAHAEGGCSGCGGEAHKKPTLPDLTPGELITLKDRLQKTIAQIDLLLEEI